MQNPTITSLRARYTMRPAEVAEAFGLPHRNSLRERLRSGSITLQGVQFGGNTSPTMYDPTEVAAEVARYEAALAAQVQS